jgi:hypothetical protein
MVSLGGRVGEGGLVAKEGMDEKDPVGEGPGFGLAAGLDGPALASGLG